MEKMDEQASLQRPFAHAFGVSSIQTLAGSTWRRFMLNKDPYNGSFTIAYRPRVDAFSFDGDLLTISGSVGGSQACCPVCGEISRLVHSYYTCTLADLPWSGIPPQPHPGILPCGFRRRARLGPGRLRPKEGRRPGQHPGGPRAPQGGGPFRGALGGVHSAVARAAPGRGGGRVWLLAGVPGGRQGPGLSSPAYLLTLIHPSAWKGYSRNFGHTGFWEARIPLLLLPGAG
jgi:hypothetical protein